MLPRAALSSLSDRKAHLSPPDVSANCKRRDSGGSGAVWFFFVVVVQIREIEIKLF